MERKCTIAIKARNGWHIAEKLFFKSFEQIRTIFKCWRNEKKTSTIPYVSKKKSFNSEQYLCSCIMSHSKSWYIWLFSTCSSKLVLRLSKKRNAKFSIRIELEKIGLRLGIINWTVLISGKFDNQLLYSSSGLSVVKIRKWFVSDYIMHTKFPLLLIWVLLDDSSLSFVYGLFRHGGGLFNFYSLLFSS